MISVHGLRVDFDDFCALKGVSLKVPKGEVYGLIGENGAGKTTLLRSLMGLLQPTAGEIHIGGIDVLKAPREAHKLMGLMPDFPPMYDDLMVWEFLDLFAASYFIPKARRPVVIRENLERVGLVDKTNAFVVELSRGMRQRLMLAKTLVPDPSVILLDEPASGMDPDGRILLKRVLIDLSKQGKTIVISSHILSEMSEFCTSVGIMKEGRFVVDGSISNVAQKTGTLRRLIMKVVAETSEAARAALGVSSEVVRFEETGRGFEVSFRGDERAQAALLARLVSAGALVISFNEGSEVLEDVYMNSRRVGEAAAQSKES